VTAAPLDLEFVLEQYRRFLPDLRRTREAQRRRYAERGDPKLERFGAYRALSGALRALGVPSHLRRRFKPQFDDLEAEITYLLVRASRPATVVEIAPDRGWSTTWLLEALRDNGTGHLCSYDVNDYSTRAVPADLASGRWTFTLGDVTQPPDRLPASIDYLFLDAAHSAAFAQWYLSQLLPRLRPGTPVTIHDIFPPPERLDRFGEAGVVQDWLAKRGAPYFTAASTASPDAYDRLMALKQELGIAAPIHSSRANPMVFFRM
jgi:predicted O-methyltransferase YrrM